MKLDIECHEVCWFRTSRSQMFCKISALKNFLRFTGRQLSQALAYNFIKKRLQHKGFPLKFAKFLITPFFITPPVAVSSFSNILKLVHVYSKLSFYCWHFNLACCCNVCTGGAVHNGCVYRELLRLKTDCKLFDKRNFCFCRVCVPFKYRKMCLRQELRLMRLEGKDIYYRCVVSNRGCINQTTN